MIELSDGDYRLQVAPDRGGSILRLDWKGMPLLRPTGGPSVMDTACFPLIPFSNRIANGRFTLGDHDVTLSPNFPGSDHPHPLHGFGWLAEWDVVEADAKTVRMRHAWPGGEWPWPYRAEQVFALSPEGLSIGLSISNLSYSPMFAGLGFHPYFLRDAETVYHGLHRGEWRNHEDCLPNNLVMVPGARDWWEGQPVASRVVDTVYAGREGALTIRWPSRGLQVQLLPSANLSETVVFSPPGESYFCVEPVSHATNVINEPTTALSPHLLAPGQDRMVRLEITASGLQ